MAARRREDRRGDRDADREQLANDAVARGFATESFVRTARVFEDTAHVQELLGRRAMPRASGNEPYACTSARGACLPWRGYATSGMPTGAGT